MKYSVITSVYNQLPFQKENKKHWDKQTFRDFEWIIGNDGSTDGVGEWARKNKIKIAGHKVNKGYRLGQIMNKAAKIAEGDYLVWVMGDSYPKKDFLEQIARVIAPNRVVSGVRFNVNDEGNFVSYDWRIKGWNPSITESQVSWEHMTLNSMTMSKELFNRIGGMYEEYLGYGREDYDLTMRAYYMGKAEMWFAPKAIVYHRIHPEKQEAPKNIEIYERRYKEFKEKYETDLRNG